MSKKDQSATLALLTYELFLKIGPNCMMIIIDVKAKWDHYIYLKKKRQVTIILLIIGNYFFLLSFLIYFLFFSKFL